MLINSAKTIFDRLWYSPTFTTWGSFFSRAVGLLAVTPLILVNFTTEEIALWYLFTGVISLGHLIDIGFSPTFMRLVAYARGGAEDLSGYKDLKKSKKVPTFNKDTNWELLEKLYGSMGVLYLFLSSILFFCLITLGTLSVYKSISIIPDNESLWLAWGVICIGLTISFHGKKYDAILKGLNYVPLVNRWNILFNSLTGLTLFFVLLFNGGIFELAIATQFWSILNVIRNMFLVKHIENRKFRIFKTFNLDWEVFNSAWSPSWRTGILVLGSQGVAYLTGIIYAQYGSPELIASYLFSVKLMNMASEFSWAPFYSKLPVYSKLRAENRLNELFKKSGKGIYYSLIFFVFATFIIACLANPLLTYIGSNADFVPITLWAIMTVAWFLERHHAMHAQIYSTTNHIPFYIPVSISAVINLAILFLTIDKLGIWAPPVSLLLSNLLINNWWNVKISLRSLDKTFFEYFQRYAFTPFLVLISIVIVEMFIL